MADKQNAPRFDVAAIRTKGKKVKGVKMPDKDNITSSKGSKDLVREVPFPSNSPKRPCIEDGSTAEGTKPVNPRSDSPRIPKVALPLIGSSGCPPSPPSLVSSADPDPFQKDAAYFIMEFYGYAGTFVNSIYDRHFLNEVFIDQHLSMPADKEKY